MMEENITAKCVICGKSFTPYYCKRNTQITCSKECRVLYNRKTALAKYYSDITANREKNRITSRIRRSGICNCTLCGKPIIHSYKPGDIKVRMHKECVIKDCINTLNAGKILTSAQRQRIYARGYTLNEFKVEFAKELS